MKLYQKYLEDRFLKNKLSEIYLEMRLLFQKLGWSDKDLERPPHYPTELYTLMDQFHKTKRQLYNEMVNFGIDVSVDEFDEYLTTLLKNIDNLTPLKHGNSKRRD
jgi:hypothetical protein